METADKALQKLEAMPLADRIAAVAADVDSKQDEFRSIDAHELASLLGIEDAWKPSADWSFSWFVKREPVDSILDRWGEEFIVELLQSQLTPERYKELMGSHSTDSRKRPAARSGDSTAGLTFADGAQVW